MNRRVSIALLALAVFAVFLTPLAQSYRTNSELPEADRTAITSVLAEQQAAWNRADVGAFMRGYWNSPELTFAGSSGITRGWEPVFERYRKQYPDRAAMGRLEFSELEMRSLGPDAALVLAAGISSRMPETWEACTPSSSSASRKAGASCTTIRARTRIRTDARPIRRRGANASSQGPSPKRRRNAVRHNSLRRKWAAAGPTEQCPPVIPDTCRSGAATGRPARSLLAGVQSGAVRGTH